VAAGGRSELESLTLALWAKRRRQDLLDLLDQLTPKIQELTRALEEEVGKRPVARRLMTHPGVGVLTALAFELVIGTAERVSLREANRQLCRAGSVGRVQWRTATARTHPIAVERQDYSQPEVEAGLGIGGVPSF
jgi:transposase